MEKLDLENEIINELQNRGADFIHFVDISKLSFNENRNYPSAILIGMILSPNFIQQVTVLSSAEIKNTDFVDEFELKEEKTDQLADYISNYLRKKGYSAFSQSENNLYPTVYYDKKTKTSSLPHKTIAGLAGIGWIGKNNLLVTPEYGSSFCMSSVLTDAPIQTILNEPLPSQCDECIICENICELNAIKGNRWEFGISRDAIVDIHKCDTCYKCLALCPLTQKYMNSYNLKEVTNLNN